MHEHVLVLRAQVTADAVRALAAAAQWELRSDIVRSHFVVARLGWSIGPGSTVDFFEDPTSDVRYVRARGQLARPATVQLQAALAHYDPDKLFEALEKTDEPTAWIRGLGRLAVLRGPATAARCQPVWERGLTHAHTAVRRAAIRTIYGKPWPELASFVRRRLDVDRALAGRLEQLVLHLEREPDVATEPADA